MSFNMAKRTLLSSIIAASSISTLALAQQQEGFTVTPGIGYYNMDSDRDTQDDKAYSLGLGYQFNNPWAVEFVYLNADSKRSSNGSDVGVDQYRLDGLYHLPNINSLNLTPYLAAGVGTADFSNADSNNTQINAGGGLKYALSDTVSLRADFRLVDDVEDHHLDNVTSLAVQMTFGGPLIHHTQSHTQAELTAISTATPPVTAEAKNSSQPMETTVVIDSKPIIEDEASMAKSMKQEPALSEDPPVAKTSTPVAPVIEPVAAGAEPSLAEQAAIVEALPAITMEVQFGNNQSQVAQTYYPQIEKLANYLKANPNTTVVIEGHTDDSGRAEYNQLLSEKRAKAIADVLVNTFEISEKRVSAIGYGEDKPLVNNDTPAHRKANRRVIAVISSNQA